jgi:tRNA(His) guanylyltransferase
MKFDDFDAQMRGFETALDQNVAPDVHIVARLDGRGFTRLTKKIVAFERPFDRRFHDLMAETAARLMQCGFGALYAYLQSDEISLLFEPGEASFGRNARKINSILAGEASAAFSLALGQAAAFDCRTCPLPAESDVVDYFRWRGADAQRNALNAHCYWLLRGDGLSGRAASGRLKGMGRRDKLALLNDRGVDFDGLAGWAREGTGLMWRLTEIEGRNPLTGEVALTTRRRLERLDPAPSGEAVAPFVGGLLRP